MSNIEFNRVGSADLNKSNMNATTRFFPLSLAIALPLPDLEVSQKQILIDYCARLERGLTHYGDFPSLQGDKKKIERVHIYKSNNDPKPIGDRYYPDYIFMEDGMTINDDNHYINSEELIFPYPYGTEGGARSNIKKALAFLQNALKLQDAPGTDHNPSTDNLAQAMKKLRVAQNRIQCESALLTKQIESLGSEATNDDWNYYKPAKAILEKAALRLSRLTTALSSSIYGPYYDKAYIKVLADELAGKN